MAKITQYSNWRVEVTFGTRFDDEQNLRAMTNDGEDIIREIKRHVDGWRDLCVLHDTAHICSHCGREWEEWTAEDEKRDPELVAGSPCCCAKAIDEWAEQRAAVVTVRLTSEGAQP